jgi:hypothetical protein
MFVVITGLHKSVLKNSRSNRPRLGGYIRTLVQEMHKKFGRIYFNEKYHLEDPDVNGRC